MSTSSSLSFEDEVVVEGEEEEGDRALSLGTCMADGMPYSRRAEHRLATTHKAIEPEERVVTTSTSLRADGTDNLVGQVKVSDQDHEGWYKEWSAWVKGISEGPGIYVTRKELIMIKQALAFLVLGLALALATAYCADT